MKPQVVPPSTREEVRIKPFSITLFRDDMDRLAKEIEKRAYQLFEQRGRQDGHDFEDWIKAEQEFLVPVPVQVSEQGHALNIRAEVPGFNAEELEVNLEPERLIIKGLHEKKTEEAQYSGCEIKHIYRTFPLPVAIVPEKAKATLKAGVLEIEAEKAEPGRQTKVMAA